MKFLLFSLMILELLLAALLILFSQTATHPTWLPWPCTRVTMPHKKKKPVMQKLDVPTSGLEKKFQTLREEQIHDLAKIEEITTVSPNVESAQKQRFFLERDYSLEEHVKLLSSPLQEGWILWFDVLIPLPFFLRLGFLAPPVIFLLLTLISLFPSRKEKGVEQIFLSFLKKNDFKNCLSLYLNQQNQAMILKHLREKEKLLWISLLFQNKKTELAIELGSIVVFHDHSQKGKELLCEWFLKNPACLEMKFCKIFYEYLQKNEIKNLDSLFLQKFHSFHELMTEDQKKLYILLEEICS